MAEQSPSIQFEDVPLEEARRMGRGPRMDPERYHALQQKLQLLRNSATRLTIPDGTRPATLKNRISRMATALGIPVTIRKVPGGLLFWRSTDKEDKSPGWDAGALWCWDRLRCGAARWDRQQARLPHR